MILDDCRPGTDPAFKYKRIPAADWNTRAIYKAVDFDSRPVLAVAPCPEDVIVSKLARLSEKDMEFVEAYHAARPLHFEVIVERIKATTLEAELEQRGLASRPALHSSRRQFRQARARSCSTPTDHRHHVSGPDFCHDRRTIGSAGESPRGTHFPASDRRRTAACNFRSIELPHPRSHPEHQEARR
jgi:hypothetical protein